MGYGKVSAKRSHGFRLLHFLTLNANASEKVEFKSINGVLDYVHILDDKADPKIDLWGYLSLPEGEGPFPAVIFVHGSAGIKERYDQWIDLLNEMGVAGFLIDCFGGRKIRTLEQEVGKKTSSAAMLADAYNAMVAISKHPMIDKTRIGVMGASRGGSVALISAWEPLAEKLGEDLRFAFHIGFYPACADFEKMTFIGAPILLLCGEKDTQAPSEPCVEVVNKLKEAGYPPEVKVFEDAYHTFDAEFRVKTVRNALDLTECRFLIDEDGETFETTSGKSMADPDEKVKGFKKCAKWTNVKFGENKKAKEESKRLIKDFIAKVFRLSATQ